MRTLATVNADTSKVCVGRYNSLFVGLVDRVPRFVTIRDYWLKLSKNVCNSGAFHMSFVPRTASASDLHGSPQPNQYRHKVFPPATPTCQIPG